ncbi:restriction endonuclease subunit M [Moraxella marmotae]|uniref:restriction endonuclease subunit M n=1 Tax=Moraxella marmotae TaxID=3344520 RepID=UPI0035F3E96E
MQAKAQIKNKQRVADHGEVYTNEREVNAMLDLVAAQVDNPEKTFLEPACGTGNFLAAILSRRLALIAKKHKKVQYDYEKAAIIAIASLYGIELLADNVLECRERLLKIFSQHYQATFPKSHKPDYLANIAFILDKNILCGDALSLQQSDGTPIIFSQWQMIGTDIIRREFAYPDLVHKSNERELPLFSDLGDDVYIPDPIKEYPPVSFVRIYKEYGDESV